MSGVRVCAEWHLGEEDAKKFALWAFGEGYENKLAIDLLNAWQERHGEKYCCKVSNSLNTDIKGMIQVWKKETANE